MITAEALEIVLKMAEDRGGFRSAGFAPKEQEAIDEVKLLLESYDMYEDYDEAERY